MRIYHSYSFTEEREKEMQEIMWGRDKYFGDGNRDNRYNNRDKDTTFNWIGLAGEDTMNDWIGKSPWKNEFIYHYQPKIKDKLDFSFGNLRIDLKVSGKNTIPNDYDFCYVYENQYKKIKEQGIINTLIFGFYIYPKKECIIIGWINWDDFKNNCKFYEAGKGRYENSWYPLSTNDYAVSIHWAEKQGILRPLADLDRYR